MFFIRSGLNYPTGLALDPMSGHVVFVADRGNNCVRALEPSGEVWTVAGDCCSGEWGLVDGEGLAARFSGPTSIVAVGDPATPGTVLLYVTQNV